MTDTFDQVVGKNLQQYREARGLSQAALAFAIGVVHQQIIARIERGERPLRYSESVQVARVLDIDQLALAAELPDIKRRVEAWARYMRENDPPIQ